MIVDATLSLSSTIKRISVPDEAVELARQIISEWLKVR